jgi:hypothetical protein
MKISDRAPAFRGSGAVTSTNQKTMKKNNLITLTMAAFAIPSMVFSQADQWDRNQDKATSDKKWSTTAQHSSALGSKAQVVTEDELENLATANDLIGSDVKGSDGETLGEIVNIAFANASHLANNNGDYSVTTMDTTRGSGAYGNQTATDANRATTGTTRGTNRTSTDANRATTSANRTTGSTTSGVESPADDARSTAANRRTEDRRMNNAQPGQDSYTRDAERNAATASSTMRSYERNESGMSALSDESISVVIEADGGFFGSDKLVKVPLSQLSRDAEGEFTLSMSKDEFEALTNNEESDTTVGRVGS